MHSLCSVRVYLSFLANWSRIATPSLLDFRYRSTAWTGRQSLTLIRVWGTAGDTLVARTYVLSYFSVVTNEFSRLSVVNYLITKIEGFFRRVGVVEWGEASRSRPVKKMNRASFRRPLGW